MSGVIAGRKCEECKAPLMINSFHSGTYVWSVVLECPIEHALLEKGQSFEVPHTAYALQVSCYQDGNTFTFEVPDEH